MSKIRCNSRSAANITSEERFARRGKRTKIQVISLHCRTKVVGIDMTTGTEVVIQIETISRDCLFNRHPGVSGDRKGFLGTGAFLERSGLYEAGIRRCPPCEVGGTARDARQGGLPHGKHPPASLRSASPLFHRGDLPSSVGITQRLNALTTQRLSLPYAFPTMNSRPAAIRACRRSSLAASQ